MTKINQPAPQVLRPGNLTTEAAKPAAPQQQAPTAARGRTAQADGFQAAQAAPVQLNPENAPIKEILPQPATETGNIISNTALEKAVKDAFALQFNGKSPPSPDELHRWRERARELAAEHGGTHLMERIFSELNKQVSNGSRIPGSSDAPTNSVTDAQAEKAVKDAFALQFNGKSPPSPDELKQWMARAHDLAKQHGPTNLMERLFTELNRQVSNGSRVPGPAQTSTNSVTQEQAEKAVKDAFALQFNGKSPPSPDELHRWTIRAQELAKQHGSTNLMERIFSELNKQVNNGSRIPGSSDAPTNSVTQEQAEKAVKDAFALQFNGKSPPTTDELHRWSIRAQELAKQFGSTNLMERLFSELNKQVNNGSRIPGPTVNPGDKVTDAQAEKAVRDAFAQQFNGKREPTPEELKQWIAKAKELADKAGTTENLMERVFTQLNSAVAAGSTLPTGEVNHSAPVTDEVAQKAVKDAFMAMLRRPPTENELKEWTKVAKDLATKSGTTQHLMERIFTMLTKAAYGG
jgi:hypothetical protein